MKTIWDFDNHSIEVEKLHTGSNYNISLSVFYGSSLLCSSIEREDSKEEDLLREGLRMLDNFRINN